MALPIQKNNTIGFMSKDEDVKFEIGSYEILRLIGKGGMGEVFLAFDTIHQRKVALKRFLYDPEKHARRRERFLREAQITSQLAHPAIIPIYTIVDEPFLAYYTMPFIEGKTLTEIFDMGRDLEQAGKSDFSCSVQHLSHIFLTICQAISYAHSKGVIHRDLKPANILVGVHGEVVILDWGIAETVFEETNEPNAFPGTIPYFAPELALGDPATYQTEIYSLGLIFYQMLTLRYPFHRTNLNHYRLSLAKEVLVDPAKVSPYRDIPPILSHIAQKCLALDRNERYQTVDEILHDLEIYLRVSASPRTMTSC